MNYARDFNCVWAEPVDNDEGKGKHRQFARAFDAPRPSAAGKCAERSDTLQHQTGNALRGGGIFRADVFNDLKKVISSGG